MYWPPSLKKEKRIPTRHSQKPFDPQTLLNTPRPSQVLIQLLTGRSHGRRLKCGGRRPTVERFFGQTGAGWPSEGATCCLEQVFGKCQKDQKGEGFSLHPRPVVRSFLSASPSSLLLFSPLPPPESLAISVAFALRCFKSFKCRFLATKSAHTGPAHHQSPVTTGHSDDASQ